MDIDILSFCLTLVILIMPSEIYYIYSLATRNKSNAWRLPEPFNDILYETGNFITFLTICMSFLLLIATPIYYAVLSVVEFTQGVSQ